MTLPGPGHNNGPTMEKGRAWRRFAWKKARSDLLPTLPIEVARRRVRRARELGIDYKAYAGIRAATGRDIVALLFSTNALRVAPDLTIASERAAAVAAVRHADLLAMVQPPHDPEAWLQSNASFLRAERAPGLLQTWRDTRDALLSLTDRLPPDGVVVIGETHLERGWCDAGRLAGFVPADRYFGAG